MACREHVIGVVALLVLQAGPLLSQAGETCGTNQVLLFHCTLHDGAKQVGLCYGDGVVSYAYGSDFVRPELSLVRNLSDVVYTPFSWASNTIFESVALTNVDTVYEVFATMDRGPSDRPAEGGIVVNLPKKAPITLTCDAGSVWPPDPFDGIGQLSQLLNN